VSGGGNAERIDRFGERVRDKRLPVVARTPRRGSRRCRIRTRTRGAPWTIRNAPRSCCESSPSVAVIASRIDDRGRCAWRVGRSSGARTPAAAHRGATCRRPARVWSCRGTSRGQASARRRARRGCSARVGARCGSYSSTTSVSPSLTAWPSSQQIFARCRVSALDGILHFIDRGSRRVALLDLDRHGALDFQTVPVMWASTQEM